MTNPIASSPFSVVIANWNGEAFIERCLGSVLAAARRAGGEAEIIVIDDASEDGSVNRIRRNFPGVRLLGLRRNVGYGRAVNRAVEACAHPWVFLLNNDVALAVDFFERLLKTLAEQGPERPVFAIGAQTRDWTTQAPNHAGQRAAWRDGMISAAPFDAETATPADFFQAGAALVDRAKFLELGGFAAIFHPGYWEDYDLAWQARRRGWGVLYEPRAVAYHCGAGSMRRRFGDWGVSLARRRNHLLMNWVNLRDGGLLARHLLGLGALIARDRPADDEAGWARALVSALARLPGALELRRRRGGEQSAAAEYGPAAGNERELLRLGGG